MWQRKHLFAVLKKPYVYNLNIFSENIYTSIWDPLK